MAEPGSGKVKDMGECTNLLGGLSMANTPKPHVTNASLYNAVAAAACSAPFGLVVWQPSATTLARHNKHR